MTVVRCAGTSRKSMPSWVTTTLAAPAQGGCSSALWRLEVQPGVQGPVDLIDAEQIWTFLSGGATIEVNGELLCAVEGDTAILPAAALRQVTAGPGGFTAIVATPAPAPVGPPDDVGPAVPAWIA